ncbi:RBR-type E3 ubiquitin transferase [Trichonephila clavipes]|nr:RBR-type E3 ubiquitin transferase [Trichonephila clavipes]
MDKTTIPDLNGTNYFIWELKMKAALSLKRLDSLIINEKPGDLSLKDEIERQTKKSQGEDRKIDANNELKNIAMKNDEQVGDYTARSRAISTKYHSLGLDVSPRNGHVFTAFHREEKLCDNTWILDSSASCHVAKESVWFKNISLKVMAIYIFSR